MPHWKRNLAILGGAQLMTLLGFSAYLSFLPYYVQGLGATSQAETMSWVALFSSGSALAMAISAPIWGTLADRYGRKLMLVRATLAGAVLAGLMGIARSPLQLSTLRILQGLFCGTVGASITLIAAETPDKHVATALGLMQTAQCGGQSLGPLIGGVIADSLGYQAVFIVSSSLMVIALIIIVLFAREKHHMTVAQRRPFQFSLRRGQLRDLFSGSNLVLLVVLGSSSFAVSVLSPILALYIQSLSADTARLGTLAGSVISAAAFTSSLTALMIGPLVRRTGQKRLLLICVVGAALIHIPQALVTSTTQLLILRAIQGAFMGGILPTANALLARLTPAERRGTVFGFASGTQAGARAVGPAVGAAAAHAWGMPSAFLVTASVFGLMAVLVAALVPPRAPAARPAQAAEEGRTYERQ